MQSQGYGLHKRQRFATASLAGVIFHIKQPQSRTLFSLYTPFRLPIEEAV